PRALTGRCKDCGVRGRYLGRAWTVARRPAIWPAGPDWGDRGVQRTAGPGVGVPAARRTVRFGRHFGAFGPRAGPIAAAPVRAGIAGAGGSRGRRAIRPN